MHLGGRGGLNYALWGGSHASGGSKTLIVHVSFCKITLKLQNKGFQKGKNHKFDPENSPRFSKPENRHFFAGDRPCEAAFPSQTLFTHIIIIIIIIISF